MVESGNTKNDLNILINTNIIVLFAYKKVLIYILNHNLLKRFYFFTFGVAKNCRSFLDV